MVRPCQDRLWDLSMRIIARVSQAEFIRLRRVSAARRANKFAPTKTVTLARVRSAESIRPPCKDLSAEPSGERSPTTIPITIDVARVATVGKNSARGCRIFTLSAGNFRPDEADQHEPALVI